MISGDQPVAWVPVGVWMAARSRGDFSLVSCCVGPGFSFDDFEMLRDRARSTWPDGIDERLPYLGRRDERTEMLVRHYDQVRQNTRLRREDLETSITSDYLDRMDVGLGD